MARNNFKRLFTSLTVIFCTAIPLLAQWALIFESLSKETPLMLRHSKANCHSEVHLRNQEKQE